ncbi:MAG: protein kinase domain-containing protein, partial [Isosphaeraceae bacterium]
MEDAPFLHPTAQTLQAYGLGRLDDSSSEAIGKHLDSCPGCRRLAAEIAPDSFLARLRNAQCQPDSPDPFLPSTAGPPSFDKGESLPGPPPTGSLPPDLADHPDYEIIRELGRGGMGTVYLALNRLMGRYEVLKVVRNALVGRPGVPDRFLGEIRNAAQLHHANIVTAYSARRLGASIIFAMEYIDGFDLARIVEERGPLPPAYSANYAHQAALGLQHAHEQGMVHRDIKPSNLMLACSGNREVIKILDFGLAKISREHRVDGSLTRDGQMLGTPEFVAPEQIRDARHADIRSDIYSLGCTLYYLLSGGPPFRAENVWDLYRAHHSMDAQPLNLVRHDVPSELAAAVAKMMAKEPERRFQTPADVAQALTPFFKHGGNRGVSSAAEFSAVGPDSLGKTGPGARPAPPQPAPERAAAPSPAIQRPAAGPREWPQPERLIGLHKAEPAPARDHAVRQSSDAARTVKLLAQVTCPHCWERFQPEQVLWISEHVDLLGDPRLGPERQQRFLPSRFTLAGDAIDARGMTCQNLACPHCHLPFPRAMLEIEPLFISILGAPASGKSYFLTSMTWELRQILPHQFKIAFTDADPSSNRALNECEESLFVNPEEHRLIPLGSLIPKTELQGELYDTVAYGQQTISYPRPFLFTMQPRDGHRGGDPQRLARMLCLYDNAGEHFQPGQDTTSSPVTRHLAQARAIIFVFDPTQDRRFRTACRGLDHGGAFQQRSSRLSRQETILVEAAARVRRHTGLSQASKFERPLLVVVSKFDEWSQLLGVDDDRDPWRTQGNVTAVEIERVENRSSRIRDILWRFAPEIVTAAESFAQDITFVAVSSLGPSIQLDPYSGL